MCHIQKIFDCSRPTGIKVIRATMHFMKGSITPLWKCGYIFYRIAECNPYPIVLYLCLVDFNSCFSGRYLVWANEGLIFYFAQREPCTPMKTKIAPGMNLIADTPQHDILF